VFVLHSSRTVDCGEVPPALTEGEANRMAMLDDAATDPQPTVAALQRELDQRTAERDEALAQQAATSEILRVIARSPTDLRPAFE
jgi:hypothetical protein